MESESWVSPEDQKEGNCLFVFTASVPYCAGRFPGDLKPKKETKVFREELLMFVNDISNILKKV